MASDDNSENVRTEVEILKTLFALERSGERLPIEIGPFTGYLIVGLCQLGVNSIPSGDQRADVFKKIASEFEPYFEGTSPGDVLKAQDGKI